MTDPIDRRANRAANSIHSATSGTNVPPISSVTRRVTSDRVLGFGVVLVLITGFVAAGALTGPDGDEGDAAQSTPTSSSTSPPTSTSVTVTTLAPTTVLDGLRSYWEGSGRLLIEFLHPDTLLAMAVADLNDGEAVEIHIQDDAAEMTIRVRFSGTEASAVLVSGIPVEVGIDGTWSSELEITLLASDGAIVVLEVDGVSYGIAMTLSAEGPTDEKDKDSPATTIDDEDDDATSTTTSIAPVDEDSTATTSISTTSTSISTTITTLAPTTTSTTGG